MKRVFLLVLHEEHKRAQEERKRLAAKAIENSAVVREGDLKWLTELYNVLIDSDIPCSVTSAVGCNKGHCRNKLRLIVSEEDLEKGAGARCGILQGDGTPGLSRTGQTG